MNFRCLWFKIKGLKCKLFGHDFLYLDDHIAENNIWHTSYFSNKTSCIGGNQREEFVEFVDNRDKDCFAVCACCGCKLKYRYSVSRMRPLQLKKICIKTVDITNDFGYIEDIYRATPEDLVLAKMLNEEHYKILRTLNPNIKEL